MQDLEYLIYLLLKIQTYLDVPLSHSPIITDLSMKGVASAFREKGSNKGDSLTLKVKATRPFEMSKKTQ